MVINWYTKAFSDDFPDWCQQQSCFVLSAANMINSNVCKLGVSYFAVFSLVICGPPPQINIDPITRDKGHRRIHNGVSTGIRLPRDVIPLHYDLRIMPIISLSMDDLRQFTSPGEVIIRILCTRSTRSITFHSNDTYINFKKITVWTKKIVL